MQNLLGPSPFGKFVIFDVILKFLNKPLIEFWPTDYRMFIFATNFAVDQRMATKWISKADPKHRTPVRGYQEAWRMALETQGSKEHGLK